MVRLGHFCKEQGPKMLSRLSFKVKALSFALLLKMCYKIIFTFTFTFKSTPKDL